ncbi:tRNA isopentenyl-2-thiomethyl-A-37 hydroxylase MiaE [Xenorhabdus sp. IM139775]|uniref:tRNA isopentenyl-2-thiomethyl-A-37 hydroxylase MiaE n=1 Tax=Xenorhabdus sp. IM139775 TaxID=3025876 RepID=UPI00235A42B8|nr:tRNA isopentenyl-2-thiomethyl-A-37 hydroxylase MiaE [Xenorhabdus sp. IM139775]MDC9593478.1 tRNA isopentenyl-2-thiomethyl-A-37 hydroxylase MiaE [Xenorhabdus sp. IM139775]
MIGTATKFDTNLLASIYQFLQCETPDQWVDKARRPESLPILLRDHLLCELKAAQSAMFLIRKYAVEPESAGTLVDKLIIGAYIEARSCERFAKLAPHLDEDLGKFYISLLRSEARHYQDYLALAQSISKEDITTRVNYFGQVEAELIQTPDYDFKFHSGIPII